VLPPVFWPNMPHLGLATIKGYLARQGMHADVYDLNNLFFNKFSDNVKRQWRISCNAPLERNVMDIIRYKFGSDLGTIYDRLAGYDAVGFSCYKSNFKTVLLMSEDLKKKNTGIKIIFGGPEMARQLFEQKDALAGKYEQAADHIIVGEGELPLSRFLKGEKLPRIIKYDEISDPAGLVMPDYSDIDLKMYPKNNAVSLAYARGCVRRCSFCAERLLYKTFRVAPVENVLSFMERQVQGGMDQFVFNDSLINGDLSALDKLLDGLISRFSGGIKWEAQIAVRNDMPDILFKKIKESGCYNLFVGFESGSDNVLKMMNKGFTTGDALSFFKQLNSASLSFGVSIIVGHPGETDEDFKEGLDFIVRNKSVIPKIEQVNPFVYYDGIGLSREMDYKYNTVSMSRVKEFIDVIKKEGFKYTNAFLMNLVEPEWR